MKIYKPIMMCMLTTAMMFSLNTTALASETIPIIDDTKDFSNIGKPNYSNEGEYVIQSYDLTEEEIELGKTLQELHVHGLETRHSSQTAHKHSIKNIKTGTPRNYKWNPSEIWTRNSIYSDSSDWPTVSWSVSKSKTVSKSVNTSVGVTDSIVSASIGANYTKSHTISTSTTRTFKIPYKKEGRVKVTYSRPYKTFTCVTTYTVVGKPTTQWDETGSGNALGKPYNIVCDIETRTY